MGDLTGFAAAGLSMFSSISSFLTVQQSTESLISLIASALRYFSPYQRIDMAKLIYKYESIGNHATTHHPSWRDTSG